MRVANQIWIQALDTDRYRLGVTRQLQDELGQVSYVQLAPLGPLKLEDTLVNLEAFKAAFEVASPLEGTVILRHEDLEKQPERLASHQPSDHWLLELSDVDPLTYQALPKYEAGR